MDSLFLRFVLPTSLVSNLAISSPGALHGQRRNRQCFWSSLCSDSDNVCHSEGKCAERRASLRKGCPCRSAHWLCFVASAPVGDKDLKTQTVECACGDVYGYPASSKEMFRAFTYLVFISTFMLLCLECL